MLCRCVWVPYREPLCSVYGPVPSQQKSYFRYNWQKIVQFCKESKKVIVKANSFISIAGSPVYNRKNLTERSIHPMIFGVNAKLRDLLHNEKAAALLENEPNQ